jgi:hypothetical protein
MINIKTVYFCFVIISIFIKGINGYNSNYEVELSKRYVQFSGAAYCTDVGFRDSINDWTCNACKFFLVLTQQHFILVLQMVMVLYHLILMQMKLLYHLLVQIHYL